jgi:Holliday junction resolvase RusA-like endonuclease
MRDINEYQFVIPGACPPKGSRVPIRKGSDRTRESSQRVEPWTVNAIRAMQDSFAQPYARFEGPVYVVPTFVFRRPEVTESEFPVAPTIGDLDKLVRCLLDAMTKAKVIEDDRFVVDLGDDQGGRPRKHWGPADVTMVRVGRVLTGLADISTFGEQPGTTLIETTQRAINPYGPVDHHECLLVSMPCARSDCPVYVPPSSECRMCDDSTCPGPHTGW